MRALDADGISPALLGVILVAVLGWRVDHLAGCRARARLSDQRGRAPRGRARSPDRLSRHRTRRLDRRSSSAARCNRATCCSRLKPSARSSRPPKSARDSSSVVERNLGSCSSEIRAEEEAFDETRPGVAGGAGRSRTAAGRSPRRRRASGPGRSRSRESAGRPGSACPPPTRRARARRSAGQPSRRGGGTRRHRAARPSRLAAERRTTRPRSPHSLRERVASRWSAHGHGVDGRPPRSAKPSGARPRARGRRLGDVNPVQIGALVREGELLAVDRSARQRARRRGFRRAVARPRCEPGQTGAACASTDSPGPSTATSMPR